MSGLQIGHDACVHLGEHLLGPVVFFHFNFLLLNLTQVFPSFFILKTENNIKHADIFSKLGKSERAEGNKQAIPPTP